METGARQTFPALGTKLSPAQHGASYMLGIAWCSLCRQTWHWVGSAERADFSIVYGLAIHTAARTDYDNRRIAKEMNLMVSGSFQSLPVKVC